MPAANIYIGSFEVRPLPESEMHGRAAGGFTCCFVRAESEHAAKVLMRRTLEADHYFVVDEEWVRASDETQWETAEEESEHAELARLAAISGSVVYSPFYTYAADDA